MARKQVGAAPTAASLDTATTTYVDAKLGNVAYAVNVPSGSTTPTITHNLGTQDVIVQVQDISASPRVYVAVPYTTASNNSIVLQFGTAPTTNQYRVMVQSAGGAATPVVLDPLELTDSAPAAPAADKLRIYTDKSSGRMVPAWIGPDGLETNFQADLARNRVSFVEPSGGTSITGVGITLTATGTATAAALATTNAHTWARRLDYLVTTPATTAVAGWRSATTVVARGTAPFGGFYHVCRFGPATGVATTTNRGFVGLRASTSAPTDVQPSTQVDCVGVGWDAADTNMQIMHNDSSGTCTKVDLGASFPVATADRTKAYELMLYCIPGGSSIQYEVTDLGTGAVATGTLSTDLPTASTFLAPLGWMSVGGTSSVIGIALMGLYIETDY